MIGKRKMCSVMAKEIGRPYRDMLAYGRYQVSGKNEWLRVGGHTLSSTCGMLKLSSPDYSSDTEKYITRIIAEV
ncbi:MAG: hypothetical protein KH452_06085 [Clostridiales bacterium]|nr:hypothetical protein [Clostridiales bacterium]